MFFDYYASLFRNKNISIQRLLWRFFVPHGGRAAASRPLSEYRLPVSNSQFKDKKRNR
jgi:hypothetical protein